MIQLITLVISGCWIFYQYVTFNKESQKLQLEKAKLENEHLQISQRLSETDLAKASQEYKHKDIEQKYADRLADQDYKLKAIELNYSKLNSELQIQKNKEESYLRQVEIKHSDSKWNLDEIKDKLETASKLLDLKTQLSLIYDKIFNLSGEYTNINIEYQKNTAFQKAKDTNNFMKLAKIKTLLVIEKDKFNSLEAQIADLDKRPIRKMQLDFIPLAAPVVTIISVSPN